MDQISADPFYSQENMARLRNSVAQMEATGGTVHEIDFDECNQKWHGNILPTENQ